MARNSEKAMTALARWRKAKEAEEGLDTKSERRPYLGKFFVTYSKSRVKVEFLRSLKKSFIKFVCENFKILEAQEFVRK